MKTNIPLALRLLLLSACCFPLSALGQGSLTPPGAPGPTMKTLAQIEPRTPISAAPFTISAPGSYYLTTNLTVATGNAITIATNGVTLDLGGFTIASTAASATGYGILINRGLRNLTIVNGFIQGGVTNNAGTYNGPGFDYGIYYSTVAPVNTRVAGVSVSGCLSFGIILGTGTGESTVVESCTVRTVGSYGVMASTVKSSVAVDCGGYAVSGDQVSDSRGESTGSGFGLHADGTAQNCYGVSGTGPGLYAVTALNCYGFSNSSAYGLYASGTAQNCYGYSSSGFGLNANTAQNCYGASSTGTGLYVDYTAQNCYGGSNNGTGLNANTAQNCYGVSSSGAAGLYAANASFCTGWRSGGTAIQATVATGCYAASGTNSITHKYNMP
jgi:hypothetical protein